MSKTIFDYTAAVGIDASADYLLIEQASGPIYKKINRNTLLGITGSPIGTSDSQSLTNKTLDNTNTVTLKDTLFTLQDDGDTTKQAKFQLSGITTATTRTYTLPNASVTLASLTGTETLTNKTITSPTITGGTYDNGTITVDSISGHTSGTIVTVANLQISNGVLNTNNSVVTANIADTAVTPAKLQTGTGSSWAWQTWVPTLTNLTLGNGTQVAKYIQIGKTVHFEWSFVLGSTSSVGTGPQVTLPVTSVSTYVVNYSIGHGVTTTNGQFFTECLWVDTTHFRPIVWAAGGTYVATITQMTASVPNGTSWSTSDFIQITGTYEAA